MLGEMVPANKTKDMEQNKSARSELLQIGARAVYHVLRLQGALHDARMMHRWLGVTICIRRDSTNKSVPFSSFGCRFRCHQGDSFGLYCSPPHSLGLAVAAPAALPGYLTSPAALTSIYALSALIPQCAQFLSA